MPTKYLRIIVGCLVGAGAALVFGSMSHLYREAERAAKYQEILAPHLAGGPSGGVYSGTAEELNQKFSIQIPSDDAFQLKFLQLSSQGGADAGTTIAAAIGGVILMGFGARLSYNSQSKAHKNQLAEHVVGGNGG